MMSPRICGEDLRESHAHNGAFPDAAVRKGSAAGWAVFRPTRSPAIASSMLEKPARPDGETIALQALVFLVEDEERLSRFLGLTGMEMTALRGLATDKAGLGAVLDYLLNWEPLLLEFAASLDLPPEAILRARRDLPGAPSW